MHETKSKIETCVEKYELTFRKIPNAIVLGKNLLTELVNEDLVNSSQDPRDVHQRDRIMTQYGTLDVYLTSEIKEIDVGNMEKPITLARQGILRKLRNLSSYNIGASSCDLAQI